MGLNARLLRFAHARPRVFLITAPGATRTRLLVEAELRRRNGRMVTSPAAASMLIVCGRPGSDLAAAVDTVWEDMPGPRSLVRLAPSASAEEVAAELDRATAELADTAAQRADAEARQERGPWSPGGDAEEMGDHADQMAGHEHHHAAPSESDDDGHGAMRHEDDHEGHDSGHGEHMEHGGHGGGHGGHDHHMGAPMGLAMAERAADRDGLKLDVLHVPLGPALSDWPAGLVLHLALQGDVVQAAEVSVMDGSAEGPSFWNEPWLRSAAGDQVTTADAERRRAACHLDSVGRLLAVAGWERAADQARELRDEIIAGAPASEMASRVAKLARRTGGSRTLRWMLSGVGVIDQEMAERHGLTGPSARHLGDAFTRFSGWLDEISHALERLDDSAPLHETDGPRGPVEDRPSTAVLAMLPELLDGSELAAARLTVASLDPDLDQIAVPTGVSGE
ncbi:hypothetical protein ACIBI3_37575 [Actinomadura luteofluorescens]|uniref:hypothetical protein n=1 Tax=Actinomadura luteofluorescens TaxID=46163 RepID=UPI003493AFC5